MSQTFSICCPNTNTKVWIGQGWGSLESLYSGEPATMERLRSFLAAHEGMALVFLSDRDVPADAVEWELPKTPPPNEAKATTDL